MELFGNTKNLIDVKTIFMNTKNVYLYQGKNWSLYKIIVHCTQTIEYSMIGYPKQKNIIIQYTVGKMAISHFLKKGKMSHNLKAPVPGAPSIQENGNVSQAIEHLINTIDSFNAFDQKLKPHLLFGKLTKNQYDKYFTLHIKDHFSELVLRNIL